MEQNGIFSQNISMEQAMAFASSPAGQQLLRILQQSNDSELSKARSLASSGDMDGARLALTSLLKDPQIQKLMKEFGA